MSWESIEFGCNDCDKFFIIRLHERYGGKDILVECPGCGRRHPRKANDAGDNFNGMPSERFYSDGEGLRLSRNFNDDSTEIVVGLKCTLSDVSRYDKENFSEDDRDKGGFLAKAWLEREQ